MSQFPLLKLTIAGDDTVGKSALVRRFIEGVFPLTPIVTVGVDIQTKQIELPIGTVKLSIWDVAGGGRFQSIRDTFYRGSLATALVYDLSVPESLIDLASWYKEISKILPSQQFIVVGNKCDRTQETEDRVGLQLAKIIHAGYARTSALNGEGVEALFENLATRALERMTAQALPESNEPPA